VSEAPTDGDRRRVPGDESPPVDPVTVLPEKRASGWKRRLGVLGRIPTPFIFLGSVILAVLVLWWQGQLQQIADVLGDAAITPLLIAIPIYLVSLGLLCYRWHVLVIMAQGKSDLPKASEAFLTSVVINYAAPVGLAVPSRAALTKRALGLDASATGTIAVWEIGADVLVLGAGTVLWMLLAPGSLGAVGDELGNSAGRYTLFGIIGALVVGAALVFLLRSTTRRARVLTFGRSILMAPRERPRIAVAALLVTTVYWIMQGVVLWLLLEAMRLDVSFVLVLGITTLPILVGMVSPIPGGAVVREALMYAVARLAGVSGGEVVAAAVIYRFALFGAIPILYGLTRIWIGLRPDPAPTEPIGNDAGSRSTQGKPVTSR